MAQVIFKKIIRPDYEEIYACIESIFEVSGINEALLGKTCLLKINAMSQEVLPGRNTSPWVLEAVIKYLVKKYPQVEYTIGDSDVAGYPQFKNACKNWGYNKIAEKYNIKVVNLAEDKYLAKEISNPACPVMEFPSTVLKASSIINLPVLKTHVLSGITCCLKNHWGMLPRFRYQYHVNLSEVISEINRQITNTVFNIVDATVCIEGSGPKTGKPKICSVILAGRDRVAVDAAALKFMDFPLDIAQHVLFSEKKNVGTTRFELTGDQLTPNPFEKPALRNDLVSTLETQLRSIPGLGEFLYKPSVAKLLGYAGTKYNEIVWFNVHGKKYITNIIKNSEYYKEFQEILK